MKIFLAGASGVIGRSLLPMLVAAGHDVAGMSRSAERAAAMERHGAHGVVVDVFDRDRLHDVLDRRAARGRDRRAERPVARARPERRRAVRRQRAHPQGGHAQPRRRRPRGRRPAHRRAELRARLRVPGRAGSKAKTSRSTWARRSRPGRARNADAVRTLEQTVVGTPGIEGVALRYGAFYGPGTAYAPDGSIAALVRRRHFPIVGGGEGLTSFVYVDDAAAATMLALSGRTGVFNICDDDPAPMFEWVPFYAARLGAPAPRHVPSFVVRVLGREAFIYRATERRGASNAKAKALLGFEPCFRSWREGFETTLVEAAAA